MKAAGLRGSGGPLGKREVVMLMFARSSEGCLGMEVEVARRLNQDCFGGCGVVFALSPVARRLNMLDGRSVKVELYSIMNSLSSFSFVGDTGAPSLMGADSP